VKGGGGKKRHTNIVSKKEKVTLKQGMKKIDMCDC